MKCLANAFVYMRIFAANLTLSIDALKLQSKAYHHQLAIPFDRSQEVWKPWKHKLSAIAIIMEVTSKATSATSSAFQVYLRLRPPPSPLVQLTQQSLYPTLPSPERWLTVEAPSSTKACNEENTLIKEEPTPKHITLNPPSDSRKRAVEKFAFTRVFEEQAEQIDIFKGTGIIQVVDGVLGECRDGLVATLGVTGSGKVSQTFFDDKERMLVLMQCRAIQCSDRRPSAA